jgi:peptidoglycan/LPS O-acetylase OafA/YrhL
MNYRQDIQILRGIAVLTVVLFHLQIPCFGNGFLGVDVFFVISGFLMAKLYDKGTVIDFYKRRIDRLLPAYSLMVVAVSVCAFFILIPADFLQLYEQALASIFFVNNIHFWNQNSYFDKTAFNPLLNLWSLSVEAQFYLIVPFLYPIIRKRKMLLVAVFCVTLSACLFIQTISPNTSFFLMPFRIWEFLVGAWVAWYNQEGKENHSQNTTIQTLFLFLMVVSFFLVPLKPESGTLVLGHPSLIALWIVFLTGAIIFLGMPKSFEASVIGRSLSKIGDYSYSIYLIHFPVIVLWNYKEFGGTILSASNNLTLSFIVLTILALSFVSYQLVENKYAKIFRVNSARITLLGFIALSSTLMFHLNENRFNESEKNIFSAMTDRTKFRCGEYYSKLNRNKPFCKLNDLGDGDGGRILLVGNSHADSIKESFLKVAEKNGATLYFVAQNDPLFGNRVNSKIIIDEAGSLNIKLIAIHFSLGVYDHMESRSQLSYLIDLARIADIRVVFIAPVPVYDVSVPQAMYSSKGRSYDIGFNRDGHYKKTIGFRSFSKNIIESGIPIYDPAEIFCPLNSNCIFADSNLKPYYFDDAHLTLTGAALLEPLFDKVIQNFPK